MTIYKLTFKMGFLLEYALAKLQNLRGIGTQIYAAESLSK